MNFLVMLTSPEWCAKLEKAYKAYLVLKEKEDEHAVEVLEQCDDVFYENEEEINHILEKYAAIIEV